MFPKAIAVDIDGTLTDRRRALNCKAVEALRKVKIPVVLATGNISCFARTAAKLIGVSALVSFLMFLLQLGFTWYIVHIFKGSVLYGSLSTVIVFLLWINLLFLTILFGVVNE